MEALFLMSEVPLSIVWTGAWARESRRKFGGDVVKFGNRDPSKGIY